MAYQCNEQRKEKAIELLLNPYHRETRKNNILIAVHHSIPRNPFRHPVEALNELVHIGREQGIGELKKIFAEADRRFKETAESDRDRRERQLAYNRKHTTAHRARMYAVRDIMALSNDRRISSDELKAEMAIRTKQWHDERAVYLASDASAKAEDFWNMIQERLENELDELRAKRSSAHGTRTASLVSKHS